MGRTERAVAQRLLAAAGLRPRTLLQQALLRRLEGAERAAAVGGRDQNAFDSDGAAAGLVRADLAEGQVAARQDDRRVAQVGALVVVVAAQFAARIGGAVGNVAAYRGDGDGLVLGVEQRQVLALAAHHHVRLLLVHVDHDAVPELGIRVVLGRFAASQHVFAILACSVYHLRTAKRRTQNRKKGDNR